MTLHDSLAALTTAPRENGDAGLDEAVALVMRALERSGLAVDAVEFIAWPLRLRGAGLVALVGSVLFWLASGGFGSLRPGPPDLSLPSSVAAGRRRTNALALAVAVALPAVLLLELGAQVPLYSAVHSTRETNVVGRVSALEAPRQRLIFAAHLDTKTDLLDHVQRAPFEFLAPPLFVLMLIGAALGFSSRPRARLAQRGIAGVMLLEGVGLFVSLTGGAFVPQRSPGAVDDGASCAVLLEVAQRLATSPLTATEVQVVFFSAEELGTQGSKAFVEQRTAQWQALPTRVINLDGVGAGPRLSVLSADSLLTGRADSRFSALIDAVHQRRFGQSVHFTGYPGITDARSFNAAGVPALTLMSDDDAHTIQRGLHSAHDSRERLNEAALETTVELLVDVAREFDRP